MQDTLGYCGLFCGVCSNAEKGCVGCRSGGGDGDCLQRSCCLDKEIDGCWLCEAFPSDKGYFVDEAWRGLCVGFVQCIRDRGAEEFIGLIRSRLGDSVEYGDFRFMDERDVVDMLCDADG